jgi:hypothetical protein
MIKYNPETFASSGLLLPGQYFDMFISDGFFKLYLKVVSSTK